MAVDVVAGTFEAWEVQAVAEEDLDETAREPPAEEAIEVDCTIAKHFLRVLLTFLRRRWM